MNASVRRWDSPNETAAPNMRRPVILSICFHLFIFIFASVGIPFFWEPPEDVGEIVMSVDIMDVADVPTAPVQDKPRETEKEEPPPPPKKTYNTASSVPDLLTPQEPDIADIPMPDAEKPKDEPPIKNPPKPKNKPKNKPKPQPKVEDKPEEKPKEEPKQFDSLLKSLVNEEDVKPSEQPEDMPDSAGQTAQMAQISPQLLASMESGLNSGVMKCWNLDAGGKYAEELKVKLEVFVNRDRTVREVKFVEFLRYQTDSHYKAAADAARRALLNRSCWPLNLPDEKYEIWKRFIYTFDPSGVL